MLATCAIPCTFPSIHTSTRHACAHTARCLEVLTWVRCRSALRDLRCGDDSAERRAVPDPFRHANDVGNNILRFETPIVRARPAETGLHFIRDADAAGGAHVFVNVLEVAIWKNHAATDTLNRFRDEAGNLTGRGVVDQALHVVYICVQRRIIAAPVPRN